MGGVLAALAVAVGVGVSEGVQTSSFAGQIATLSEPGGYFDTDNLISNERSYLQVIPAIRGARTADGAYIGVGPDTNFSYIAEVRPSIAFIIDVRRDNLLLHLLFKALFELSATRVEYLSLLLGRSAPGDPERFRDAPITRLVEHIDRSGRVADAAALRRRVTDALARTGVPLSRDDLATIERFHQRFMEAGLDLRFTTLGRPPQPNYPSYRELLLETDATGRRASYLADEEAFQFIRSLQARNLVIPVVGDLSGPSALAAIGRQIGARRKRLTAFYTSNVEFYLYRQGTFPRFVDTLRRIPRARGAVVIRSVFGRPWTGRPGDGSTSITQPVAELLRGFTGGRFRSYGQLVEER